MSKKKILSFRPGRRISSFRPSPELKKKVIEVGLEVQKENEAAERREVALKNKSNILRATVR